MSRPDLLPADLEALPVRDVAPLLHCSRVTVYALIKSGRLRAVRLCGELRVPVVALRAYLAGDLPSTVTALRPTDQRRAG